MQVLFICRQHLDEAKQTCGLQPSVTGTVGFRTIHQVDLKAQMVLLAESSTSQKAISHSCVEPEDVVDSFLASHKQKAQQSEVRSAPRLHKGVMNGGARTWAEASSLSPLIKFWFSRSLHVVKNNPDAGCCCPYLN